MIQFGRRRARYRVEVAWDSAVAGVLQLDRSTLGGPDVLAANSFSQSFGGVYSDLTASEPDLIVDEISTQRGRSDDLQQMLQATCSLSILDTAGILNPKNPLSPLAGLLRPQRPLRVTEIYDGSGTLTVSGNETTDATRATAIQGDGRQPEGSTGLWSNTVNSIANGGFETNVAGWALSATGAPTLVRDATRAKFGAASGRLTCGATAAFMETSWTYALAPGIGLPFTASVWIYAAAAMVGKTGRVYVQEQGGASASARTETNQVLVAGWNRLTVTRVIVQADRTSAEVGAGVVNPVNGDTVWIDGAQFEAGRSIPSPYVHTDGAIVERGYSDVRFPVDGLTTACFAFAFRVRMGFASTDASADRILLSWADDGNNKILVGHAPGAGGIYISRWAGGATSTATFPIAWAAGDILTIIVGGTDTQIKVSVNGAAHVATANTTVPALARLFFRVGSVNGAAQHIQSDIFWEGAWAAALSDADAAALHARLAGGQEPTPDDLALLTPSAAVVHTWPADSDSYYYQGGEHPGYYGFIRSIEYEPGQRLGHAKIEAGDLFTWLETPRDDLPGGVALPVIASTGRTTTGAALGKILDAIGWTDLALRVLDEGTMIPDFHADGTQTPLTLIAGLLEADRGLFFIDRAGRAVYEERNRRQARRAYASVRDSMQAIAPGVALDKVINSWKVERQLPGGGTGPVQLAQDLSSGDEFGPRENTLTTPYLMTDLYGLDLANYLLGKTKDPDATIWHLELDNREQTQFMAILESELNLRLTLAESRTGTSGDYFIEQIAETISRTDKVHRATMLLSEREPVDLLVMNRSTLGSPEVLGF